MGGAHGTLTYVEGCSYSGMMESTDNGGSGNYGGIIGYIQNATSVYVNITNCLFDGKLVNTADSPGNCTFGGMVGYANSPFASIKNCLSIGSVQSTKYAQFFGALNGPNSKIYNSYYQGDYVNGASSGKTADPQEATLVTNEQLGSGEITWKLNDEMFIDPVWHQVLGDATYPVPYGDIYGIVYQTNNKDYESIDPDSPASVASFISNVIDNENEFIEEAVAYQELIDAYTAKVQSWENIEKLEEFLEDYKASLELKESIKESAANYAAYVQACQDAAKSIVDNQLEGEWTEFILTYLNPDETQEPTNDYPNGSYAYIMENLNLDDEAIVAEITFVNQMLENAIAGGITSGTEITRLMVNPRFTDGYEGWNIEFVGGTADVGGNTEIMPIPEAYNNNSFNASQTLTQIPNGIYMMTVNGLFRAGADVTSQFYAGQLYLNNTYNYFMSPGEDVVSETNAEIGVNCLGEAGEDVWYVGNEEGWVPNSRKGCSVAFNAGRYQNFCATEVTDSTLTIGMCNPATGLTRDWMPFGNLHIFYLGTTDEANDKLTEVLDGYKARADIIMAFIPSDDSEDYAQYPNMSEALKTQLSELVSAVPSAATGKDKMELINKFSALFTEIHACRRAYITMFDAANKLYDLLNEMDSRGLITDDMYNEWDKETTATQNHYIAGDVTTEEALAIADKLNNANLIGIPSVDGVYQLATANDLIVFSGIVNFGMNTSNAVLINDIDMTDCEWNEPIGFWGSKQIAYKGHFNGQGHCITNLNAVSTQNFFGLFGVLSTDAIVENFTIYGEINNEANQQYMGVIGYARDQNVTIRDIHSYVDFINAREGGRQGGILGCADNGTISIDRCTYSGNFQSKDAGGSGNYGGIVGYCNNNAAAVLTITNCLFDGKLVNTADSPGNCTFGGMVGYANSATVTIKDCLSIGTIQSTRHAQFFGALNGPNSKIYNCYYQGDYINGSGSGQTANPQEATKVEKEQLTSGEVCYKLNGDQSIISWYQNIGEDSYPVLDNTHKIVIFDAVNGYQNAGQDDEDGISLSEELRVKNEESANAIYDLSGRKINSQFSILNSQLKKGIYIQNGKKVLY